jgi:hypothetical protein
MSVINGFLKLLRKSSCYRWSFTSFSENPAVIGGFHKLPRKSSCYRCVPYQLPDLYKIGGGMNTKTASYADWNSITHFQRLQDPFGWSKSSLSGGWRVTHRILLNRRQPVVS